jgi:signal transduction histidine kinase
MATASKNSQGCTSLRVRLLVAWAIFIALTLGLTDIGLRLLFERSITRRTQAELAADLRQIRRGMETRPGGVIEIVRKPTDPQFDIVFGGRYWQVAEGGKILARSASLGAAGLATPQNAPATDVGQTQWFDGPKEQKLFAFSQTVTVPALDKNENRVLTVTTAVDAIEIKEDTDKFSSDLHISLGVLGAFLLLGSWWLVLFGLRPLEKLRSDVASVREGKARTLDGSHPDEVMPLVEETNALLEAQHAQMQAARDRAGDLAHGLKTPLAVMSAKSRQLRQSGQDAIASEIESQVQSMNQHVERELARARTRGSNARGQEHVDVAALTDALVSILQGLPRGQDLSWTCDLPSRLDLAVDAEDYNTLAGNLLENAQKWAVSRISVVARKSESGAELVVEDDGPGIPESEIGRVLKRGERADMNVSGSGLGLAIVSDTVEIYKGALVLSRSSLGGLKAVVTLPG